jgi:hypothetical protein
MILDALRFAQNCGLDALIYFAMEKNQIKMLFDGATMT